MVWYQFAIRLMVAFAVEAFVGAERQWRQRIAGLRTNCLVALGSAMFVMMGGLMGGTDGSQGRVAAYVVSAIGFISGGVILKEGFSIRGLNTAAQALVSPAHQVERAGRCLEICMRCQPRGSGRSDQFPERPKSARSVMTAVTAQRFESRLNSLVSAGSKMEIT